METTATTKRDRWILTGLVLLALALRLGLAIGRGLGDAPRPGSDQSEYDTYAWNVAQGRGYRGPSADVKDPDHLTAFRPPGTSIVWAGVYKVFGHRYGAIRILNCTLGAISIFAVYTIGARCYGRKIGLLAAAGYAVWPTAILYSADLLSEPLGTLCFLCFVALCLRFAKTAGVWTAVLAGLMLGYALLTRPNVVFMVPLVGLWVLWLTRRRLAFFLKGALIPVCATACLIPWTVRNYFVFNAFIPISTLSGSGLLQGNNRIVATDPKYRGYSHWDSLIPEYREALVSANDEVERDRRAKKFAIRWLNDNKDKWLFLAKAKFVRAWTPFLQPHTPRVFRVGMLVSWGPVLVLFAVAFFPTLWAALRRREPSLLLHLSIVNFVAITLIFWGETRYRHGIEPLCLVWAALTVMYVARRLGFRWAGSSES
jgi:4-amino-4-deoxy-L-arabinose transferase-like glycosyltransferase